MKKVVKLINIESKEIPLKATWPIRWARKNKL